MERSERSDAVTHGAQGVRDTVRFDLPLRPLHARPSRRLRGERAHRVSGAASIARLRVDCAAGVVYVFIHPVWLNTVGCRAFA